MGVGKTPNLWPIRAIPRTCAPSVLSGSVDHKADYIPGHCTRPSSLPKDRHFQSIKPTQGKADLRHGERGDWRAWGVEKAKRRKLETERKKEKAREAKVSANV